MGKILVTDDDPVQRATLHALIEKMKHTVFLAANGRQALELLEVNKDIDLLITDIYMPEMDGRDLVKKLRCGCGANRDLPVIIMSSAVGSEGISELLEMGTTEFLAKPLNGKILQQTILKCFNTYSEQAGNR